MIFRQLSPIPKLALDPRARPSLPVSGSISLFLLTHSLLTHTGSLEPPHVALSKMAHCNMTVRTYNVTQLVFVALNSSLLREIRPPLVEP